jgi:tetratricopeptide (TPR) repeat protein
VFGAGASTTSGRGKSNWRFTKLIVAVWCLTIGYAYPWTSPLQSSSIDQLFASYQAGRYQNVSATLSRVVATVAARSVLRDLERRIDTWPTRAGSAFALEVAAATVGVDAHHTAAMLRKVCSRLRRESPKPSNFELEWHLAALALLAGPLSDGTDGWLTPFFLEGDAVREHYRDAIERFPHEPALLLTWGVAEEAAVHGWLTTWGFGQAASAPLPTEHLRNAAAAFEEVQKEGRDSHRREAMLRLGSVRMHQNRTNAALELWIGVIDDPAAASRERFLGNLLRGRALIRLGRHADAEDALRAALVVYPRAQSALFPFAALRFLHGDRVEVAAWIAASINGEPLNSDPWLSYFDEVAGRSLKTLQGVRENWQ